MDKEFSINNCPSIIVYRKYKNKNEIKFWLKESLNCFIIYIIFWLKDSLNCFIIYIIFWLKDSLNCFIIYIIFWLKESLNCFIIYIIYSLLYYHFYCIYHSLSHIIIQTIH
jgi:hypothetical protein